MPDWDDAQVMAASKRVRLNVDPRRRRIGSGARLGAGAGSSLEFHDHRSYTAGDDLRHLDWSVFARTDQLMLRRHRQEVSPRIEVVLDLSLSMAVTKVKLALATNIAALVATLAEADGARPIVWLATSHFHRLQNPWRQALRAAFANGAHGLGALPTPAFAVGSERILITDGLCPQGGQAIIHALGSGAGRIACVHVLTSEERAPSTLGAVRLEDVEGGAGDLMLDDQACTAYRERLARHLAGWQTALVGRGAGLLSCTAEDGFDVALHGLLSNGLLDPRAG
jgi:uncharacterized protein (DUF58 family)